MSKYYSGPIIPPTYLRKRVLDILEEVDQINTNIIRRTRYKGGLISINDDIDFLKQEFYNNIIDTDYTLCVRGTGNFSTRFYETLALGRIPIFINTDCILPFDDVIDWERHILWIELNQVQHIREIIKDFHSKHTTTSFRELQNNNRRLWENYFSFSGYYDKLTDFLKEQSQRY
tara:strand:+ start:55 stop:576 length:522 start_codon:yes stop_codon:yes gene_type:complete